MADKPSPPRITLRQVLDKFPEVELPVTLGEETHHVFSRRNDPIPALMVEQYLQEWDGMEPDEHTEYVACFRIPISDHVVGVVYWRAGLLEYRYELVTLDRKSGQVIAKQTLGGTLFDGMDVTQSVATISEEKTIYIASGQRQAGVDGYSAAGSTAQRLQLTEAGKVVEM